MSTANSSTNLLQQLRAAPIFSETRPEVLQEIADAVKPVRLEPGDILFRQGETGDAMYVIAFGSMRIHRADYTLSKLQAPVAFGEYALVESRTRSASATALEPTTLLRLDRQDFDRILSGNLTITKSLLKNLIKRMLRQNELEQELAERTAEVDRQSQLIINSIRYAQRIQSSFLQKESTLRKHLPESFIYFKPRNLVSGDFYWFAETPAGLLLAAVDCTGHGVPGAFLSLIGHTLLEEAVRFSGLTNPGDILISLHEGIATKLKQADDTETQDGMDVALCLIDRPNKQLHYAGARNHLYQVRGGQLTVHKGNFRPVGGTFLVASQAKPAFDVRQVSLEQPANYYIGSDGFLDQFGGPKDEKFNTTRFGELLLSQETKPLVGQAAAFDQTFESWKADRTQLDDILVIGFRI